MSSSKIFTIEKFLNGKPGEPYRFHCSPKFRTIFGSWLGLWMHWVVMSIAQNYKSFATGIFTLNRDIN